MRCQAPRLGDDRFAGAINCRAADGCGSRAPGAVAVRHLVRVALNDRDVLYGQAETVSSNLREGYAVPLAMRMAAAQHRDPCRRNGHGWSPIQTRHADPLASKAAGLDR